MGQIVRRILAMIPVLALVLVPVMPSVVYASATINEYSLSSNPSGSFPTSIAKGPDNNLWFTVHLADLIGRITTNGNVVEYPIPSGNDPGDITAGSDGAMWFTEPNVGIIGRITTAGDINEYSLPAGDELVTIINGPDGSLWFSGDHRITTGGNLSNGFIGRITTSGDITVYSTGDTLPLYMTFGPDGAIWFTSYSSINGNSNAGIGKFVTSGSISAWYPLSSSTWDPTSITTGPDGALWFADGTIYSKIGRITVDGDISSFPISSTTGSYSQSITTGPDGALWFTDTGTNSVGRITTSGSVTEYPIPTSNTFPRSITTGPDGALWFVEQGSANRIGQLVLNPSPVAPTNLTAASPARFPNLSWSSVTGATSYNIYRNGTKIGSTTNTTYTDNTAPEGTDSYYVTAVNSAGESSSSNTVSVLVDRTAPTITYSVAPTPNSNGWNNSPTTVTFSCNDNTGGSGIAICPAPQTESTEGSFTLSGTAIDNAGNSATTNVTVNIDTTAPVLGTPTWTNNPMTTTQTASVSVPVTDNLSGVSNGEYYLGTTDPGQGSGTPMTLSSGNLTASFSGLTPGIYTANFRAEDAAGNWSAVTTDYLVAYDATQTSADGHSNRIVPVYGSDVMPGLVQTGQTDTAAFAFTVKYNNGGLVTASKVHFSYKTGTSCNSPNAANCHSTTLDSTSIDWMIVNGTNNSLATVQGTATLTIDGVTTSNPFRLIVTDGARLSPSTNDQFELDIYAPGANPNTAQPIYHMNEPVTNGYVVVVR